MQSLSFMHH